MKQHSTALLLLFLVIRAFSQSSFNGVVSEIKNNIFEVESSDITFNQSLELMEHSVMKYRLVTVDKKGKQKELIYEFNVADLDPYLVREETRQDVINLSLSIDNGQKFIKKYENEAVKGYIEKISIPTIDIDNARALRDLFKEAIPLAKEIVGNKLQVETLGEMEDWLAKNISDVESGSKFYSQKLSLLDDFPTNFLLIQTSTSSKSTQEKKYIFNLSDININSLKFTISGTNLSIDLETNRKQKLIKILEDETSHRFDNKVKIYTNNVEEARDLKNILMRSIPLAKEKAKSTIPSFKELGGAINFLKKYITTVEYGDETFEQSLDGESFIQLTRIESGTKSSKKIEAEFSAIDINESLIDYQVVSNKMFVSFSTNESQDLIKLYKDEEFQNYTNKFRIYTENIEAARRAKLTLESIVQICKDNHKDPFQSMSLKSKIAWLEQNIEEVQIDNKTITQTFEKSHPSDPNKIKLTILETGPKNSIEEIYEFNLTDLNPESIQFDIGNKRISIPFETKYKEDIIKHYKNGKLENYQNGFKLQMTDIETARNVINVFKQIIRELDKQ